MPKMKTNRGAAKRFKRAANGGFRCRQSYRNHILTKKAPKRKRQLRSPALIDPADAPSVSRLLPYA
jgi:large subunit ribosomal protein L35